MAADTYISNVVPYGHYNDTDTIYGVVRNMSSQARDVANGAWDTFSGADMGDYDISAGTPSGGLWVGDFPVEAVNGFYIYQIRIRAGGSPASGDEFVFGIKGYWNGAVFANLKLDATGRTDVGLVVSATPITLANINAEMDTALADLNLDHFIQVSSLIRNDSTVSTTTVLYTELAEATADHYNNLTILFTSGILAGQARRITDYSNDATDGIVTVYPAFTDTPGDNDTFIIIPPYFYMPLAGAIEFTYTVTASGSPVAGVEAWITTDITGNQIVWNGTSNASGVILDSGGNKPWLDAGTYYIWKQRAGYIDDDWPDTEVVS